MIVLKSIISKFIKLKTVEVNNSTYVINSDCYIFNRVIPFNMSVMKNHFEYNKMLSKWNYNSTIKEDGKNVTAISSIPNTH